MGRLNLAETLVVVLVVATGSEAQESLGLLPPRCGMSGLTNRIIDGGYADPLAWPWVALLYGIQPSEPVSSRYCNGVLINDRYVLSVGNCFANPVAPKLEFVRLGEHSLDTDPDCQQNLCAPTPQDIPVEQVIVHPQYRSPCRTCNDIALLRLARPATLHPLHVVPICLPVDPLKDMGFSEEEFQGKFAYATTLNSPSFERGTTLRQILLPIEEGDFCLSMFKRDFPDPRMALCAGGQGKDTCGGDSGMPLMLANSPATKVFVVGLSSFGPVPCGRNGTQSVYTNVHYYAQWIIDNLRP
ncbi:serine protease 7-like [Eriocheir sinensis]|uniref:serine protease 7-like n=1 Tax=Eriocheir sinensis TaxID=95602 RepID=UPI0021C9593D|nr:serine protease 7-like [Eriocheir sinensis]